MVRIRKDGKKVINSKQKGASYERKISNILKERGYEARRSVQYNGAKGLGDPDVLNSIDLGFMKPRLELKAVEALNIHKAMRQAVDDLKFDDDPAAVPIIIHKKNGEGDLVTFRLEDWLDFIDKFMEL